MKLTLHTDYALRTLLYLGFVDRKATTDEVANVFGISKDHLLKVVRQLRLLGYILAHTGRHGGISLARPADDISVGKVVAALEGRNGILECIPFPESCPLEPGCSLKKLLLKAENAFYDTLIDVTVADLMRNRTGGLHNLQLT